MLIAVDFDGTLYDGGIVANEALESLRAAADSGHAVMIVTGRRWEDLRTVAPRQLLDSCVALVCEEGGLLVNPHTDEVELLTETYDPELIAALTAAGVDEIEVGHVVLASTSKFLPVFEELQQQFAPSHHVILNKGSVALAPPSCDKGTGLKAAAAAFGLDGWPIIAIGDATNDLPMFAVADYPCVVANADPVVVASGLPMLGQRSGHGVAEALAKHLPVAPGD